MSKQNLTIASRQMHGRSNLNLYFEKPYSETLSLSFFTYPVVWVEALEWEKRTSANEFLKKRTTMMSLIHEILKDLEISRKMPE